MYPIVCATAHRDLPDGCLPWLRPKLRHVVRHLYAMYETRVFESGMALGGDSEWAEAVLDCGAPLRAVVPFEGQQLRWPPPEQVRWQRIIDQARDVLVLAGPPTSKGHAVGLLHGRNDRMLTDSAALVAIWDPAADRKGSGTFSCVLKAAKRGMPVIHVDPAAMVVHGPGCPCVAALPGPSVDQPALPLAGV